MCLRRECDAESWETPGNHSSARNIVGYPDAAIIEGWALRLEYVVQLSGDISGLFLLADAALIEARIRSSDFSGGASDAEIMISALPRAEPALQRPDPRTSRGSGLEVRHNFGGQNAERDRERLSEGTQAAALGRAVS